jgi:tripartite-type tricarboxylate transporter receptor subunit TctC
VKAQLEKEFVEAARTPDVKGKFEAVGFEVVASDGEGFTTFLKSEIDRWKDVIQKGNITAE